MVLCFIKMVLSMPSLTNVKWEIDISVASFSLSRYCCTLPEPWESGDIKKTHFTFPIQAHSMLPVNLPYDWCLYLLPPKSHCIFPNHKTLYQVVSRYLKLWSWCQTNIIFFALFWEQGSWLLSCFLSTGIPWWRRQ